MNRFAIAFIAAVTISAASAPLWAQSVIPVQFPTGQSGTTITDRIVGRDYKDYRISLRAGQMLSVSMQTVRGSPYFNVVEPGAGDVAIYNSSINGPAFEGRTRMRGDYTVRVYQMRASERRGEVATYRLTIGARGSGMSHPTAPAHHPADALVPGTPYHATSLVRCRTVGGGGFGNCKAGVIRRPGSATLHLDTPDGGERTILFRDGRAMSSDASAPLRIDRRGDTSVIRIGTVEIYEIPDALPLGG